MELDGRIRFYLENRALIDEWARLQEEARAQADRYFRTDVLRALQAGASEIDVICSSPDASTLVFSREGWSRDPGRPAAGAAFSWEPGKAAFDQSSCGVWVDDGRDPSRETFMWIRDELSGTEFFRGFRSERPCWPRWKYISDLPTEFWADLNRSTEHIVKTVNEVWNESCDTIDRAIRRKS